MYLRYLFFFILFPLIIILGEYLIFLIFNELDIFKYLYIKNIFIGLGIILPIIFLASMFYGLKHFSLVNSWLYTAGGIWIGMLTYFLIVTLIAAILILINNHYGLNIPIKQITNILIIFVLGITIYGLYKSSNPKIITQEVESPTLSPLWKDKKIAIISDVHIGETRREKFIKKIVGMINNEKPDIVFILGDLIDGQSFPYEKGMAPLYDLKSTLGTYYVEGNHESYSVEYPKFKENLPTNIKDVTSEKLIINNTQIIGIPYSVNKQADLTEKELGLISYDKKLPSIILLHDPKEIPLFAKNGASLILSGHTHGGQFFPFTMIVKKIYGKYSYGLTYTDNTPSFTSSGVGTAVSPIRIGTNSEIVILKIK